MSEHLMPVVNTDLSPVKRALQEIRELRSRLKVADDAAAVRHSPIAIVGAGMRFPGGIRDAESLWEFLASGKDAITEIPRDRWDWRQYFDSNADAAGTMYAIRGGFLEEIDKFDADFFGIAPREAAMLDPQQRLLHEVAWHALENAGISPGGLRDASGGLASCSKTGIFLGLSNVDYYRAAFADDRRIDAYAGSGNSPSMAAGRLAYTLGVHGPAITVDTSCSSSLVAVHLAVQSLRSGESDVALAGGVNVILGPQMHIAFSRAHMLAPDGHCKTFDAAADGYVRSEGCGIIVVKRLQDAVTNGDRILAVIRGSATNHDGRSGGLTAPSSHAQAALLREAFANAVVGPDAVQLIEAHGTGTSLGDPIEMEALGEVFRGRSPHAGMVSVGSIKTNLGHTEAASGIAGLLKLVMALQHQTIPAHLHFKNPSPFVPWQDLPFTVPTEATEWRLEAIQRTRVGGVSSFGFSGSNAHVVLEEFTDLSERTIDAQAMPQIATLSARSPAALRSAMAELGSTLEANPEYQLADVCGTLARGRTHLTYRAAWAVKTQIELVRQLAAAKEEQHLSSAISGTPSLCFLFTGQGSEYAGMGLELYAKSTVFSRAIERLETALGDTLGVTIPTIWANGNGELEHASLVQPALYAYGWALSELWRSWGVEPNIVLGHSLGEYIAATVAGVMTPEEGVFLVAARGRLTDALAEPGGMIALPVTQAEAFSLLAAHPFLSIAAINGTTSIVVSGCLEPLQQFEDQLRAADVRYKRLGTTHGFHSAALDGMLDAFEAEAVKVNYRLPEIRWISNFTGLVAGKDHLVDAKYWRRHLRSTVEFSQSVATARNESQKDGSTVYLEIGTQPQLLALFVDNDLPTDQGIASVRKGGKEGEWHKVHDAAAQLYCRGASLDWNAIQEHGTFRMVTLPGYPFERKRYWFDDGARVTESVPKIMAGAVADQSEMVPMGLDVTQIGLRTATLNRWAKSLMISTLKQLGCLPVEADKEQVPISSEILIHRHGLVASQARFVDRWFKWLSEDGSLVAHGDPSRREFISGDLAPLDEPAVLWKELEQLLDGEAPQKEYLAHCSAKLLGVLRGEINPLETLFPNGDETLARRLYEESSAAVYLNRIVAAAVAARAGRGSKTTMGYARRTRILEIGAGTGATTASILRQLAPEDVHYTFSDVSEVFLARARQRFRKYAIDFVLFDLDRDEDSHAAAGRYDLVVIANALHVAKDLRAALQQVLRVLQPGGSLVLLETTTELVWSDVSIGMIEGWQHFDDRAQVHSPLLSVGRWMEELEQAGFEQTCFAPSPHQPTNDLGLHVFVAHRPIQVQLDSSESNMDTATMPLQSRRASIFEGWQESSLEDQSEANAGEEQRVISLRDELLIAPARERLEVALKATCVAVAKVLGHSELPAKDARLMELGMDSLMAMELRNMLQKAFEIPELSTTLMFDYPTALAIAVLLLSELGYTSNGDVLLTAVPSDSTSTPPPIVHSESLELHSTSDLDAMSDDEIANLLRAKLGV